MKTLPMTQGSEEWIAFRRNGIGASDIPAILGISPFRKAIDIFNEKKGLCDRQFVSNAMMRGTIYEGEARHHHNKSYHKNFQPMVAVHDDYDYFFASLDGYDEQEDQVLEIKVPMNTKLLEDVAIGDIPEHYMAQVQWQLFVSGSKTAIFAVYSPEEVRMEQIIVDRDEELIERLKSAALDFWINTLGGVAPEEKTAHEALDFPEYRDYFREYRELKYKMAQCKKEMDYYKPLILALHSSGNWKAHGLKITEVKGRESYDISAMQKDGIDINKYKKIGKPYCKIEEENETSNS